MKIISILVGWIILLNIGVYCETTISGKISLKTGEPAPGVSVKIGGSGSEVLSNSSGIYKIKTDSTGTCNLIVQMEGYTTISQKIDINKKGNLSYSFILKPQVFSHQVTVTATKSAKPIEGVTASVKIIGSEKIRTMGAINLTDIFEKTPGITLQYGTSPSAGSTSKASVSIRGLKSTGTLFLIDGRRFSGEVSKSYDLNRIPAGMIKKIEIVKGPMSVLYGSDAIGGVINIITREPEENFRGYANIQSGLNSERDGNNTNFNLAVMGKIDKLSYSFYAGMINTNPYTENEVTNTRIKTSKGFVSPSKHPNPKIRNIKDHNDVDVTYREESRIYNFGGRTTYNFNQYSVLGLDINYFKEKRDGDYISSFFPTGISPAPGKKVLAFDTPVHSHDNNWRRDLSLDYKSNLSENFMINFKVYNSYYKKRRTTTAINWEDAGFQSEEASQSLGVGADVNVWTYEGYLVYSPLDNHTITTGAEYRKEEREATVFNPQGRPETRDVNYKAAYLQDEWQITSSLNSTAGIRYDAISNAKNKFTFKAGLVNTFSDLLKVRVNFAQGYRAPDIKELFILKNTPAGAQRGSDVSDPAIGKEPFELKPEFINSYELGVRGNSTGFHYSATVFYNDMTDMISQVTKNVDTPQEYYTFENISEAKTWGFELSSGIYLSSGLGIDISWYELKTENKKTGKKLEFTPERQISGTINYKFSNRFSAWTTGTLFGKQFAKKADNQTIDSYFTVDLGAALKIGGTEDYEIYFGINNVFDKKVDKLIGSNVGTYFYTGIRASF